MPWYAGLIHFLASVGLWHSPGPVAGGPVYLDNLIVPARSYVGEAVTVTVAGSLPSPAYVLREPVIERGDHQLWIHLASDRKNSGPSIQMLQPFSREVVLADLPPGTWVITADAPKSDAKDATLEVYNR